MPERAADLIGEAVSLNLTPHIAEAVESGDDLIVDVGAYPTRLQGQDRPHIFSIVEAIGQDG